MRKLTFGLLAFIMFALFAFTSEVGQLDTLESYDKNQVEVIAVDLEADVATELVTLETHAVINSPPQFSDLKHLATIQLDNESLGSHMLRSNSYAEKDHQNIQLTRAQTDFVRYPMLC